MIAECSFSVWYPLFGKESLEAVTVPIPDEVMAYLEHESFRLPVEARNYSKSCSSRWSDGTLVLPNDNDDVHLDQAQFTNDLSEPSYPMFSNQIKDVLNEFGAVFVKLNWSAPLDAAWVAPTKTLRCTTLEEIYLLLKSSDRLVKDLNQLQSLKDKKVNVPPCLVLKKWREINPCAEFRCFVINGELVGICQRDLSQYYLYIETEKYDIRQDIKSLFHERIKKRFESLTNYVFDVIRHKKDHVKIIDFSPYVPGSTKTLLFMKEELNGPIFNPPEFRLIGENVAIQPNDASTFCIPREINEFYQTNSSQSMMDIIQQVTWRYLICRAIFDKSLIISSSAYS
ncbi:translation initiation factor eIF2 assembly protein isoform X2 [Neodiprion pinetum]|uniref:Cell division cycle protein 123 homolog isoform X2 n=1 Tax=Neodiprion lecontei TaxID=441921 RepID=A0A6J0BUE5_NEOLC|nr:cell division cycle protein 123 homolog isoform X2 [Neodiprion lecontei]XP_046483388.1 cell division cycle protein 123 homolog isoform X2 [Neodiprion pinetum]